MKSKDKTNPMYRYLEKYVGTYRVKAECTWDEPSVIPSDPSFDDLYIPCSKGVIKHTYKLNTLCWYCDKLKQGRNVRETLDTTYPGIVTGYEETDDEVLILFDVDDIKKIAKVVKPKTNGASINPFSIRNLPKNDISEYTIPADDLKQYTTLLSRLTPSEKLYFVKNVIKDFDETIAKEKGKRYNIQKEKDETGLKGKEFIHSIGMWNQFLLYLEERIDEQEKSRK